MSCSTTIRGNTVVFTANFYDQNGQIITPVAAQVRVAYAVRGVSTIATLSMTNSGGTWTADWDSSVADAGNVDWHTQSTGSPSAADDGSFTLSANAANPQS